MSDVFGDKPKAAINSKQKGNTNERQAAKWLELFTGSPFARSPSSGGIRWKNNSTVVGDVVCQDEDFEFPFVVETKHLKEITYRGLLRRNSEIYTIWSQADRDAGRAKKWPMAMLRHNGMPKGEYIIFFDRVIGHWLEKKGAQVISWGDGARGGITGFNSVDIMEWIAWKNFDLFIKSIEKLLHSLP